MCDLAVSDSEILILCKQRPIHSCCVDTSLLVLTSRIIPVSETLDRSKRMILGTEDTARSDLFEIKSLVRVFVIRQVFRQNDMRHIDALCFCSSNHLKFS